MPTGVPLRDVREQLFDAAERILLRTGPGALTSRAVTAEAGVAKGVVHRHFADFDDFLVALVRDRVRRLEARSAELRAAAGTGSVAGNVADALGDVFGSVALEILRLVIFRDDLRERLRSGSPNGLAILSDAAAMLAAYLSAERDLGRVGAAADVDTLALTLVGTGHLVFAGRHGEPPPPAEVLDVVTKVLRGDA